MGGTEHAPTMAESAFAAELRLRLAEAEASLESAERLDDPLLAQIAAAGLADLRSLAARNDLPTDAVSRS